MSEENQNQAGVDAAPPPPADPYGPETMHEYASVRAPQLRTRVVVAGQDVEVQFNKGVVRVDGPTAREMDRCIEKQIGGLYQLVKKLDRNAAIALATQHANRLRGAAAKGGFSSAAIDTLKAEMMGASGQTLAEASPNNPEGLAEFAKDLANGEMLITEMNSSTVGDKPAAEPPKPRVGLRLR